jgi:hypothetical protein
LIENRYPDLLMAAEQVAKIAAVMPKEKVAILADRGVDPGVLYAVWGAMQSKGAEVYLFQVEKPTVWYVPPVLKAAISEMNVVITSWPIAEGPDAKEMRSKFGTRWIAMCDCRTEEMFISEAVRFPIELMSNIISRTWQRIYKEKDINVKITCPKGTNLSLQISARELKATNDRVGLWRGKVIADEPGSRGSLVLAHGPNLFLSNMALAQKTINGVVVYDSVAGLPGAYSGGFGDASFRLPVTVTVQQGQAVDITGGWEAKFINQVLEGMGRRLTEIGIGFNPKFPTANGQETGMAGSNHTGAMHIAFGDTGIGLSSSEHVDGCLFQATLMVDGETIIDAGRLTTLDDPVIRELASKYGDPAHVLMELV